MNSIKIISTLKKLDKSKWDALLMSCNDASQYYSKRSKAFYIYLSKQYPVFDTKQMSKEKIYAFIFPSKTYNDIIFRQTIAEAKEILHNFLIKSSLEEDTSLKELLLLRGYRKIGADALPLAEKSTHKGLIGEDYFLYQLLLNAEKNKSKSLVAQNKSRKIDINLGQHYHSLEEYYLIERLRLSIDAINYKNILGQEHAVGATKDLLAIIEKQNTKGPLLEIYKNILCCLLDFNDAKSYEALKTSLMNQYHHFHKNMSKYMFGMAQNFCIRNINAGRTEYLKEIFELFKFELDAGILFENEILATWDYKNIVTTALRLKEYDWTKTFIEKYKNRLENTQRENAYTYNLAKYHFEIADYKNVLKGLVDVIYTDVFYHLDAMILLIKTYYLMDEIEAMFNVMDTLKIFIIRQKQLSKYQAQTYQNFMKYLKKISNTSVYDKARISKISEDISKEKVIADIGWLKSILQKLN